MPKPHSELTLKRQALARTRWSGTAKTPTRLNRHRVRRACGDDLRDFVDSLPDKQGQKNLRLFAVEFGEHVDAEPLTFHQRSHSIQKIELKICDLLFRDAQYCGGVFIGFSTHD